MGTSDKSADSTESALPDTSARKPQPGKKREAVIDTTPEPAPRQPTKPHHTRCKVVGTTVLAADGKMHPEGDVDEFADSDVLSLPEHLIPVE